MSERAKPNWMVASLHDGALTILPGTHTQEKAAADRDAVAKGKENPGQVYVAIQIGAIGCFTAVETAVPDTPPDLFADAVPDEQPE